MSAPNGTATTGLPSILQDAASATRSAGERVETKFSARPPASDRLHTPKRAAQRPLLLQKLLDDLRLEGCSILLSHTAQSVLSKASLRANFLSPVWL